MRNEELQNKLPAASRQAEPVCKRLLFAKQTAGCQPSSRACVQKTTFCKTNCRLPAVKPSPCGKDYFLQNKLPAASRQAEPVRKRLLFAKQTAGCQPSSRARAGETTFCKTNCRLPAVKPSPCGKNYFLQNKLPAASRQAEPVCKRLLFAKQTAGCQPSSRACAEKNYFLQNKLPAAAGTPSYENGGLVGGFVWVSLVPPLHSLDSGFRRNDELRGRHNERMPQMTDERLLELSILLPNDDAGRWLHQLSGRVCHGWGRAPALLKIA